MAASGAAVVIAAVELKGIMIGQAADDVEGTGHPSRGSTRPRADIDNRRRRAEAHRLAGAQHTMTDTSPIRSRER